MKAQDKLETALPFPGFYESWYDHEMDNELERIAEHYAEEWKIEPGKIGEELSWMADFSKARLRIAQDHCDKWLELWSEETGIDTSESEFSIMTSPREYNFETDRVFVKLPFRVFQEAYALCEKDKYNALAEVIEGRFTSYDGFMSYYSNDIEEWLNKPLSQWDHNELQTLLQAALATKIGVKSLRKFDDDVGMAVLEYGSGNSRFDPDFDTDKLKEKVFGEVAP